MNDIYRKTAAVLSALILFITLFSVFYTAAEYDHDCDSGDCPVCACIHFCECMTALVGSAAAVCAKNVFVRVFADKIPVIRKCRMMFSPVLYKVRMND